MTSPASVESTGPPPWFTAAMDAPVEQHAVEVDGTTIAYRAWGDCGDVGLVLVHGGGAHARWWDHIAPLLERGRRVVALDLSGHGDSGRRDAYTLDHWSKEALAVAAASGIGTPPTVARQGCGVGRFRAERGVLAPQLSGITYDRVGRLAPVIEIPAAGHHVMLDQPIALVTGIRALLSEWDHSLPARPR